MNTVEPFMVLGLAREASEEVIRSRYLELVKQFPPERNPDKFRAIRAAFEAVKDPLANARQLLVPPSEEAPPWSDAIEAQKQNPPRLTPALILSLGNRAMDDSRASAGVHSHGAAEDTGKFPSVPPRQAMDAHE